MGWFEGGSLDSIRRGFLLLLLFCWGLGVKKASRVRFLDMLKADDAELVGLSLFFGIVLLEGSLRDWRRVGVRVCLSMMSLVVISSFHF